MVSPYISMKHERAVIEALKKIVSPERAWEESRRNFFFEETCQ
jgi:hypothetical protein